MLVGERDVAARAIRRSFAPAPLDDTLGSGRVDWRPNGADALTMRYAGEDAEDTGASSLDRAIGSASYRQRSTQQLPVGRRHLDARDGARRWSTPLRPPSAPSTMRSCRSRPAHSTRSRACSTGRPSGAAGHHAEALPVGRHAHAVARRAQPPRRRRVAARERRPSTSACSRTAASSSSRTSPSSTSNGDGRVDDGDLLFAVTLRSGKPDQALLIPDADNDYVSFFVQDDWRLRPT